MDGGDVLGGGIIPARAGFTRRRTRPPPHRQDHPRSRGVYAPVAVARRAAHGSSPLARGLHVVAAGGQGAGGIIPARAGFTPPRPPRRSCPTDHPRSRGVYATACAGACARRGSSPLARGLHRRSERRAHSRGIIPARAGFTLDVLIGPAGAGDHPRSRGVYPLGWAGPDELAGIIPARAGFTRRGGLARRPVRDHPRSRGVYDGAVVVAGQGQGSSPLARGLPLRIVGIPTNP